MGKQIFASPSDLCDVDPSHLSPVLSASVPDFVGKEIQIVTSESHLCSDSNGDDVSEVIIDCIATDEGISS